MSTAVPKPPYPKAPITEAVIALHFAKPPGTKALEKFAKKQKRDYPNSEELYDVTANISIKDKIQNTTIEKQGFKLTNADNGLIVRVTNTQLGVSKLAPYEKWEELFDEARRIWVEFKKTVGAIELRRVSTRFINRIDIPAPKPQGEINLAEYLTVNIAFPEYAAEMKTQEFSISCRLLDEKNDIGNIIKIGTAPPLLIDHVSIVLDIDVVTRRPVPQREEELWAAIDDLRVHKNNIFEASITDKTRELFQ